MTPETFLSEIWDNYWMPSTGKTLPLPAKWRIKVLATDADPEDWAYAVQQSINAVRDRKITTERVFDYSLGIVWNVLAARSYVDTGPTEPYPSPVFHARLRGGM